MNILVLGGTRYFGVHLVENLLKKGHNVTIATRGLTKDTFGENVKRITVERTSFDSLFKSLGNIHFDAVYDNLAYCSNDVIYLLDSIKTDRYIMTSTMSVYSNFHDNIVENEFNPLEHKLKWCSRQDFTYDEIKRQAECALFQKYTYVPSVAVRFPYVIGEDDYTKRLLFYIEHTIKNISMCIDNPDQKIGFVSSGEAGHFLSWLAEENFTGTINAASKGHISIGAILEYLEKTTGKKAIVSLDGEPAPYNGTPSYSINTDKASSIGYTFSDLDDWIYCLLEKLVIKVADNAVR